MFLQRSDRRTLRDASDIFLAYDVLSIHAGEQEQGFPEHREGSGYGPQR